jgi:hypothetical protein
MALGSTLSQSSDVSRKEQQNQANQLFNEAWNILPNLIMQRDLWALKSVTLMVGCHQSNFDRFLEQETTDAYT